MGQLNLIRSEFEPAQIITSSLDANEQLLAFTEYFEVGDIVDIVAKNDKGCYVGSPLATNLIVCGIMINESLLFDESVDTSTALPAGAIGWYAIAKNIDDGQSAIDRLYHKNINTPGSYQITQDIMQSVSAFPTAGQTALYVDDVDLFRAGDEVMVSCLGVGVVTVGTILSIDINADEINNRSRIVIDKEIDLSGNTGCQVFSTQLTIQDAVDRINENIDAIDAPVENEYMGNGNCDDVVFETDHLFLLGTSKLLLDGRRLRLGLAGTRASYVHDSGDAELTFTSLVLGENGNNLQIEIVSAAGTDVTVTGTFKAGNKKISINNDSGAATAEELADALNNDADARKLVMVQWGGNGTGTTSSLAATNLAGGLNDGEGDYAELPQLYNNEISLTGYKWLSLWILPDDRNRLSEPPQDSEELVVDYRRAMTNA